MLAKLQSVDGWIDGPELANAEVGGSEGLKRLRELRDDDHHDIRMRKHPDPDKDIFQYRLARAPTPEALEAERVIRAEPADKPEYGPRERPPRGGKLGRTESGAYVYVPPEPSTTPVAVGQTDMGVEEVQGTKFTAMPTSLDLGRHKLCTRCGGHRRAIREKDPVTGKALKGGPVLAYEDYCRDPEKPSEPCRRCNGFGVIPA